MDTNRKPPAGEGQGGKKPYHGKRRPQNKHHGKRRPEGQNDREAVKTAESEAVVAKENASAADTANVPATKPQNQPRQAPRGGKENRPKAEERAEVQASDIVVGTEEAQADGDRQGRPAQRPQRPRNPVAQRKAPSMPQMNNLLIDDCPEESADVSDYEPDIDAIERILSYDIFAQESHEIPEVIPAGKVVIVGIRFRAGGKTYFFDPGKLKCAMGQYAIVETARGYEFGEICIANRMVNESQVVPPLRPVVRLATEEDIKQNELNHQREEDAFRICREKITEHGLDMSLVAAQYTFDDSKLLFYFTADGRVDFRNLVKDLAGVFHIRIELRQIGIRDEARMLGGLGACGRPLCCSTFLSDFGQVSMKMAKEQNLTLNTTKISGCCGRLMCCLRYEHESYERALKQLPSPGTVIKVRRPVDPNKKNGPYEEVLGVVTDVLPIENAVKVSVKNEQDAAPKKFRAEDIVPSAQRTPSEVAPAEDIAEPDSDD